MFEELLDIWHGLQQSGVDSKQLTSGERVLAPVYGSKWDILSYDNMLIECVIIEAAKLCSKFVECVFQIGYHTQSYHKSLAQLCHQELVEQLQHFSIFFMFHTVVQRGF